MRKLLLIASAFLVAACGDSTSPGNGVVVTAVLSSPEIQAGQRVTVNLSILNQRSEEVNINLSDCNRPFEVLNPVGGVVGPGSVQVCSLALIAPTRVPPGGTVTFETHWNGDATGIGPADEILYVAPGSYLIRPRLQLTGDNNEIAYGQAIPITVKR